jgi:ketosteroid isomerase-like protein
MSEPFKKMTDAFSRLSHSNPAVVDEFGALYADDVEFQDPLQKVTGKEPVLAMNRRLLQRARTLSVEVHKSLSNGDDHVIFWTMRYAFKIGPEVAIEGATHLRKRGEKIVVHRDYWDMLSSVMTSLPLARELYRTLAPRLA